MKLLLQRVARASVEVNGYVENRIGNGLVVFVAVKESDTADLARQLASKVASLKLWCALGDAEKKHGSSVVENGLEVLVILQQSLLLSFPAVVPLSEAASLAQATPIFEAFVAQLQANYQVEMVVGASVSEDLRVDLTVDCPGVYQLEKEGAVAKRPQQDKVQEAANKHQHLPPGVKPVKAALKRMPLLPTAKAILETSKIVKVLGMEEFQAALTQTGEVEMDEFVDALDGAAHLFSASEQEKITEYTGLPISALPREEGLEQADLAGESDDKAEAGAGRTNVKKEDAQGDRTVRTRADRSGLAAPDTPGTNWSHPAPWNSVGKGCKSKGKGKSKVKGGARAVGLGGIASLDLAARLHGHADGDYSWGQFAPFSDRELKFNAAKEEPGSGGAKRSMPPAHHKLKFAKGTPTIAPMCPPPSAVDDI